MSYYLYKWVNNQGIQLEMFETKEEAISAMDELYDDGRYSVEHFFNGEWDHIRSSEVMTLKPTEH